MKQPEVRQPEVLQLEVQQLEVPQLEVLQSRTRQPNPSYLTHPHPTARTTATCLGSSQILFVLGGVLTSHLSCAAYMGLHFVPYLQAKSAEDEANARPLQPLYWVRV